MMIYSRSQFLMHPLLGDVILKILGRHVMSSHQIDYLQICLKRDKYTYMCLYREKFIRYIALSHSKFQ